MTTKFLRPTLGILLALLFFAAPSWAGERIRTDGTNKESPIKVNNTQFQDSGYGLPGPNAEIRVSTVIANSSKEDDLKNVIIRLQLTLPGGDVVQEWTKNMSVLKKGETVEFDPGAVYYNYSFNNLQPSVEVEHDKPEEKKEEKEK